MTLLINGNLMGVFFCFGSSVLLSVRPPAPTEESGRQLSLEKGKKESNPQTLNATSRIEA